MGELEKSIKGGSINIKNYKTIIVPIKTTQENLDYLYQCNKDNAKVWNECIKLTNNLWEQEEKYIDRKYLQQHIKGNFSNILYSKCIQVTIKKYLSNISGIIKAKKAGRNDILFPYKQKKNFNTMWDVSVTKPDYINKTICLPKPKKLINGKLKNQNPIKLHIKNMPKNIAQVEVIYKNGLKLAINYYEETEYLQIKSDNICAIDMGEIHAIATIDNNGNPEIITGRQIRSFKRFRNKQLGELQQKLRRCNKGSINYNKYRKAIRKLLNKTNDKIKDSLNKITKKFSDYIITNDIKTVIFGDLTNFNMNLKNIPNKKGQKQKLVQWEQGKLKDKIENKVKPYGVNIVEISEKYTSQTCPNCGHKHKPTGRNYVCKWCGYENHRDIVGAINILSSYLNDGKIKRLNLPQKPLKYLRIE